MSGLLSFVLLCVSDVERTEQRFGLKPGWRHFCPSVSRAPTGSFAHHGGRGSGTIKPRRASRSNGALVIDDLPTVADLSWRRGYWDESDFCYSWQVLNRIFHQVELIARKGRCPVRPPPSTGFAPADRRSVLPASRRTGPRSSMQPPQAWWVLSAHRPKISRSDRNPVAPEVLLSTPANCDIRTRGNRRCSRWGFVPGHPFVDTHGDGRIDANQPHQAIHSGKSYWHDRHRFSRRPDRGFSLRYRSTLRHSFVAALSEPGVRGGRLHRHSPTGSLRSGSATRWSPHGKHPLYIHSHWNGDGSSLDRYGGCRSSTAPRRGSDQRCSL